MVNRIPTSAIPARLITIPVSHYCRSYLVGDRFSAADLAFVTLAAAVILTPGYGVKLPALEQLPDRMANGIRQFQATLAGKFVLRLYQEYEDEIN
jgi:glutathione S-transferase